MLAVAVLLGPAVSQAVAAPVKVDAVMSTKEQIRLDFADGGKHFVVMVRREGKASSA